MNNRQNPSVYTHQLRYGDRLAICNELDANQSWKTLAGTFFGLNTTELTLLGQAYMRNSTPASELFNRFDSANLKIEELSNYLTQMKQMRAVEFLKPYLTNNLNQYYDINMDEDQLMFHSKNSTLDTPTPSFADIPQPAIMGIGASSNPFEQAHQLQHPFYVQNPPFLMPDQSNAQQQQQQQQLEQIPNNILPPPPTTKCHKQNNLLFNETTPSLTKLLVDYSNNQQNGKATLVVNQTNENQKQQQQYDPGDFSNQEVVNQLRLIMQITYDELKQASNNFSDDNKIGNGGFASVYRGNWKGTDVAIKRLKCNLMDQALNELTILNSYRIDNILPIYGISINGPEACLVYQFMSNGSLEDRLACLKDTKPLTWNQRALIGEGVAKGLYYLHTLRDKPLVHGDVKSANVLLDSQLIPKLGDFGLARQVFKGKNPKLEQCTHCTVSSIHGTSVYLPPEYLRHKILSPAVDVYSYGIVLLEMATGRRAYDGKTKQLLIDFVEDETKSMSRGQISYSLKDSRLANDTQNDLKIWYELLIKLGLDCAHKIKKKRLDMGQVLNCFSSFKNQSNNQMIDNSNYLMPNDNSTMIYAGASLASSNGAAGCSTARTITPDLTALSNNNNNNNNRYRSQQQTAENNQQHQQQKPLLINNYSSLMMTVDEEQQANININYDKVMLEERQIENERAVEAMIPLLTELGVDKDNK